jgi:hypothetical protein
MKKILVPAAIIIILQGFYILKLRHDLDIRNKINEETILQAARIFDYVKHEEMPDDKLPAESVVSLYPPTTCIKKYFFKKPY